MFFLSRPLARPCFMLLMIALLVTAAPLALAQESEAGDVPRISNGAVPVNGVQTLEMEELWRIGGEDDEDVLLGIITRALVDDENNIYLLDQQLSEAKVFDADGELINTLGRQGSGPGEVNNPGDFVIMPDGTLGLVQIFPGKIVKLEMDGTPAGDFNPNTGEATAGGFLALVNVRSAGGNLVLSGIQSSMDQTAGTQTRTYFVRGYDMEGEPVTEFMNKSVVWDFTNFKFREIDNDFIWWRMDVGSNGKLVVCPERYEYSLQVFSADGTLERVIDREYESWTRTEEIKARYDAIMDAQLAQFPPGTEKEVEDMEQDVSDLRIAADGSIWVLPSRQMFEPEPGAFATYDVFTPDGIFDRQVRIVCEGNPMVDRLIFAGEDRIFQVTGFWDAVLSANAAGGEDDDEEAMPMEVICYKVK